jgi:diguanylate cyclase (GGDEF)-like protein
MDAKLTNALEILIVDDDPRVRDLLTQLLSDRYGCSAAGSGPEALEMLRAEPRSIVISDVSMPGMSGHELVPLIIGLSPDTVVIMISGDKTIDNAIAAIRAGAFDFVKKPFDFDQVELAVERAAKHHHLLVEKRRHDEELEILVEERSNRLNFLAYYDELTGLPKRNRFEDLLDAAMLGGGHLSGLAVLAVALDRFMDMRDTLGSSMGDDILKTFAARLRMAVGADAVIGRLDTSEFGVVLPGAGSASDVVPVVERVFASLGETFRFASHDIFVSATVGVSMYPGDATSADALVKNASVALSHARSAGKMNFAFFGADMHERALRVLTLGNELRNAVRAGQLKVYYQPKVNAHDGRIVGCEALVRWQHPTLGIVPPTDFIPIAEETGVISEIGKWILRETCVQLREWQGQGYRLEAAVNVSPVQFDDRFVETVREIILDTQVDAGYLNLEVTETSIMQNGPSTIQALNELRDLGIKISIDDFGTGYSSLALLKSLPVNVLKIDRSFIKDLNTDQDDASLVMSIISLAHNLKLTVVAEGVETAEQLQLLKLLRCDEWQGFLFSTPVPAVEFSELLLRRAVSPDRNRDACARPGRSRLVRRPRTSLEA